MLNKNKKRKYEKLREADFKPLKEDKLEKPSKKTPNVAKDKKCEKDNKIEEEEGKICENNASDSEKYDTEFEDEFDDEYGI